ncbi:MAG: DUF599 domain-containing protein [Pseudomonadota bacterium]
MTFADVLSLFTALDAFAVGLLIVAWIGIGVVIENAPAHRASVSVLMKAYRRDWMHAFVTRSPRIFDAQILGNLRQGTAFFASACMIAMGGGLALIGNTDRLLGVAEDLAIERAPAVVWEVKILLILLFIANAFLKFVWAHRLFGYCSVVMAAVPNDETNPSAYPRAAKAAEINITAATGYNRGLRSIYFGLGSALWLIGAPALILATLLTLGVIWRREFASRSRSVLLMPDTETVTQK